MNIVVFKYVSVDRIFTGRKSFGRVDNIVPIQEWILKCLLAEEFMLPLYYAFLAKPWLVWRRDLNMLMTSLKRNSSLVFIFYLALWLCWTRFVKANRTLLVCSPSLFGHTRCSSVHVQSLRHNVASHCHLSFQQYDSYIVMLYYFDTSAGAQYQHLCRSVLSL